MIVIDTNLFSELMRPAPFAAVLAWFDAHKAVGLWTTSVNAMELWHGAHLLPDGARKDRFLLSIETLLKTLFADRILPFDTDCAQIAARIAADRERRGRIVGVQHAQIAGIALAHNAALATRNTRAFEGLGLDLINPWDA